MDLSRYDGLRALVRANVSETTQCLVDQALEYAAGKLEGRKDASPPSSLLTKGSQYAEGSVKAFAA